MPPIARTATAPAASAALAALIARAAPAALAALAAAAFAGPALAQSLEVTSGDGGRVSIRAGGASAADVAAALGESTGVAVVVTGDASTALDVDIVDEPLEKAVAHLAPNHLLMRGDAASGAPITEIVLMMPDGDDGGVESTEFLPTGEPTDGVVAEEPLVAEGQDGAGGPDAGQSRDGGIEVLRDPDRAAAVRAAAASAVAAQAAAQAAELAGGALEQGLDDGSGIDPATGEPYDGALPLDDGSGIDPSTGLPYDDALPLDDGSGVDPATGQPSLDGTGILNR